MKKEKRKSAAELQAELGQGLSAVGALRPLLRATRIEDRYNLPPLAKRERNDCSVLARPYRPHQPT